MITIKIILSLAASHGWDLYQMDINNALLQGVFHEIIYMTLVFQQQGKSKECKLKSHCMG